MLFRSYSSGRFFDTRRDSTFSRYSPGFHHFSVLTQIRPFSGSRRDRFSKVARILSFPGTRPNSTVFQYLHRFNPFPVLAGTVFRYSHGFYLFPVLAHILPLFGTHTDSTIFRYLLRQFFDTRTDSSFSRSWPIFYHFSVLTQIRPFSRTR